VALRYRCIGLISFLLILQVELGLGKALGKISCPIDNFKSLDADTLETIVEWPPPGKFGVPATMTPPMLAVRKQDLIRLLFKALSGSGDEDINKKGTRFEPGSANNSDFVGVEGVEGDLAMEKWFLREKWRFIQSLLIL
jgi:hypothetical protein